MTNPLSEAYNEYTIETETELVYDAPELNKWQYFWNVSWKRFWGSNSGKQLSLVILLYGLVLSLICPEFMPIFLSAIMVTAVSLVVGATIVGLQNEKKFWSNFVSYINEEWAVTLAVNMVLA